MKRIFYLLLALGMLSGMTGGPRPVAAAALPQDLPPAYRLVAENTRFALYANPETLALKVLDKQSGYLWHSGLDELAPGDRLNKSWAAFASSGLSIEYLDNKAINRRISISNSNCDLRFTPVAGGFDAEVTFVDFGITLGLQVRLEESGIRVQVPAASIRQEIPDFRLGLLYLYPFFGATRGDEVPGYMFIPDGSGALIQLRATTKAKTMFYGKYYGPDLGMITALPHNPAVNRPYQLTLPVLGMVHGEGQNAYLAVVAQGASYGELHAHPAGIITNFNFLYNAFIYNESYFQATNRAGAGVTVIQPQTNAFDVEVHYRFLSGQEATYTGMARAYQRYLVERGVLHRPAAGSPDISVRLEFLGGDKEKVLFWQRMIPMTTVAQLQQIVTDLGIANVEVVYYGWQPLGASSMPGRSLRLEGQLGDLTELQEVAQRLIANGGQFSLYLNPQAAFVDGGGYSTSGDLALSITRAYPRGYHRNMPLYYFNFAALQKRYRSLSADVFSQLGAGLALDGIGAVLYSDFSERQVFNREQALRAYQQLLAESEGRLAFYTPNDYVFGVMSAYYDIPLGDSGYLFTDQAVPFLQIVLAGYVPGYGPALNFSADLEEDLLRHMDYGVYPSYFLSYEVTGKILNTRSDWIYTSSYAQWGPIVAETYARLNRVLAPVKGQEIVAREQLAPGVWATTYANGKQIVVNFNPEPFSSGAFVVNARDAAVRDGVLP